MDTYILRYFHGSYKVGSYKVDKSAVRFHGKQFPLLLQIFALDRFRSLYLCRWSIVGDKHLMSKGLEKQVQHLKLQYSVY